MAIKYRSENGTGFYDVSVVCKSKVFPKTRVQRTATGIRSKANAKRIETRLRNEAIRDLTLKEQQGQTWGQLLDDYELALITGKELAKPVSRTTKEDYMQALRKYTHCWSASPASAITKADVRQMLASGVDSGISPNRMMKVKSVVSLAFKWGLDTGRIRGTTADPTQGVNLGRPTKREPKMLTREQIKVLLREAKRVDHPWYPVWATALLTGMRNGELFALKWTDIDFENRTITVSRSFDGRHQSFKTTKSGDWRTVTINSDLENLLLELRNQCIGSEFVLPRLKRWAKGEQSKELNKFLLCLGLPRIRFHDLRACFATQLMRDGVSAALVMRICGWKELKTMQFYMRLASIEIQGATDSLRLTPAEADTGSVRHLFHGK